MTATVAKFVSSQTSMNILTPKTRIIRTNQGISNIRL